MTSHYLIGILKYNKNFITQEMTRRLAGLSYKLAVKSDIR